LLSSDSAPIFLTLNEVNEMHEEQLALYGGMAGTRDHDALDAAAHMPQQSFGGEYVHRDLFEMAAAYLFHIALDHPYVDGNKRTAAEAADVFLFMNGYELTAAEDDYADLVLAVAGKQMNKSGVGDFLRSNSQLRPAR